MKPPFRLLLAALLLPLAPLSAQQPPRNPPRPIVPEDYGQPLPGLGAAERAAFDTGRAEFVTRETPASGLGPTFNDNACIACHDQPAPGGGSRRTVTRFGRTDTAGHFDPLAALGGSLLQDRSLRGVPLETVPADANVVALRVSTPLFGAGLVEAIADDTLVAAAAAAKPAGIRGRAAVVVDPATGTRRIGRFGWKAQHASLLGFTADAGVNELGITNRFFPGENAPNGNTAAIARFVLASGVEDAVDPADGQAVIDRIAAYLRFLAPPPAAPLQGNAVRGRAVFAAIDCAACHTPALTTAPHAVAALSQRLVPLYSDLLLHDMGALGDGIAQGDAGPTEMRTAPLWGLRTRRALLHDGRATSCDAAIRAHDGEAARARDAYAGLPAADRQALLDFLNTL